VSENYHFDDFTEQGYQAALKLAQAHWQFESFGTTTAKPHVLWRHDIDVSPHRALRLAEIENENGVKATYFFLLHSDFYNCLETSTRDIIRRIAELKHDIGLHFDIMFYPDIDGTDSLERRIEFEAAIVGDLAMKKPNAVSFHNPTPAQLKNFDQSLLAGLVNAYGHQLRSNYGYVSDSNGYWRFRRLHDVLSEPSNLNHHVLTHPEWWTPDRRSPRERIGRAVEGRAANCLKTYETFLLSQGRLNVR
jgi:hypothetical protein